MTPRGPVSPASESVSSRGMCSSCSPATSYPVPASVDTSAPTRPLTSPTHGTPVSMSPPSRDSHPTPPVVSAATIALNVEGGREGKSTCLLTMFFFLHGPGLLLSQLTREQHRLKLCRSTHACVFLDTGQHWKCLFSSLQF